MSVKVIKLNLNDQQHIEALLSLLNEYANDPMGGNKPLSDFTHKHLITELKKRQGAVGFLAFKNEQAVGFLNAFEGFSTFQAKPLLNIHDVFVKKAFRGQKISRKLFESAEQHAVKTDCCKVTLEVLEYNSTARKAYEKFAYKGNMFFLEKSINTANQ